MTWRPNHALSALVGIAALLGAAACASTAAPVGTERGRRKPDLAQTGLVDPLGGPLVPPPALRVKPSPNQTPNAVVELQLAALKRNDDPYPDAGIAIAYVFASPSSRAVTGEVRRFARLLKTARYRAMLDHRQAVVGEPILKNGYARVPAIVQTASGQYVGFVFQLSRQQSGPLAGCWLTDGVKRFDVPQPK
ncbi:MAG: DUF4864 domain-containing protein [Myxococcales bacterium]|nr:DUF4864 domain-containing protein [Myxococcales bacterium]